MKILWLTNIPSPYRVEFFNELGKHYELTVLFERSGSSERDENWKQCNFISFNGIIIKGMNIGADKALSLGIVKHLKKHKYDHIIVSNALTPTGIIAIKYMRANKISYSIESDGAFPKNGKGLKERLKSYILKGADIYFSTSKIHDEYYLMYGAKNDKIVRYPFTSIRNNDILKKPLEQSEKDKIRNRLGIKEDKVVLSVGQFIYRKGYDVLIKASSKLGKSIGVYIIGGTPTKEYLGLKNKLEVTNVHFGSFKTKECIFEYFSAADLFVLPTREDIWGLVINEAMAFGLPVITTNKCIAGLELIRDYENGFIIPIDDVDSLTNKINEVLNHNGLCTQMSIKSIEIIQGYTIEKMVEKHIEVFEKILFKNKYIKKDSE